MKNSYTDAEWIDHYIRKTLKDQEREWVQHRLNAEPDFIVLYAERKRLIEGAKFVYISDQLREMNSRSQTALPNFSDYPVYLDMPDDNRITEAAEIESVNGYSGQLSRTWKRWAVAAAVVAVTSVYMLVLTKQPPRPMDCLVTISSLNKCF